MEPGQPVSDSLGQGHVLTSTRGSALLGCAAVALLVGLVGLSIARGFFGIVFGVIAVIAVVAFCVGVYERRHWEPLQLTFEQWPLQLGGSYSALVSRHAKTRARQRSLSFTSELSCFERVTYDQGDDTENERAFVLGPSRSIKARLPTTSFAGWFRSISLLTELAHRWSLNTTRSLGEWRSIFRNSHRLPDGSRSSSSLRQPSPTLRPQPSRTPCDDHRAS